jgi:hypothetical protein
VRGAAAADGQKGTERAHFKGGIIIKLMAHTQSLAASYRYSDTHTQREAPLLDVWPKIRATLRCVYVQTLSRMVNYFN